MANYEELSCEELKKLCKKYERQLKRVDKIVKAINSKWRY
jgi:hypothetical protein